MKKRIMIHAELIVDVPEEHVVAVKDAIHGEAAWFLEHSMKETVTFTDHINCDVGVELHYIEVMEEGE